MALTAAPLLIGQIKATGDEPLCVISPDLGGGKRADLLLLAADPLESVNAYDSAVVVVLDCGEIARDPLRPER